MLGANGIKAGLFRPITLILTPYEVLAKDCRLDSVKSFLAVESQAWGRW